MRHDLKWFYETLRKIIWDYFDLMPNKELEVKTTTNDAGEEAQAATADEANKPPKEDPTSN